MSNGSGKEWRSMDGMIRFPLELRQFVEPKLQRLLWSYVDSGDVPRCLLAFVGDQHLEIPYRLKVDKSDPEWEIHVVRLNDGLIGEALRTGKIEAWQEGKHDSPYHRGEKRTVYEIAAGIPYRGRSTAVLLIDYFRGEQAFIRKQYKVERCRNEIEQILLSAEEEHREVAGDIELITERIVVESRSVRGFAAIMMWDGTIRYFAAGADTEKFEYLNQLEGLCGEAFRTGEFINVSDVFKSKSYHSSDDSIHSEAVAPIWFGGEVIGVLNMESTEFGNFDSDAESVMTAAADDLSPLADRYRTPPGGGISKHSRGLSDLVEKFSVDNFLLGSNLTGDEIRGWARGLCCAKIRAFEDVVSAEFIDLASTTGDVDGSLGEIRKAVYAPTEPIFIEQNDGKWVGQFDVLREAVVVARLEVVFRTKPDRATREIVGQFSRLTGNEIRRRIAELGATEFERIVDDINSTSVDGIMVRLPMRLKRMLDCDEVTFFKADDTTDNGLILRGWQSTARKLVESTNEPFYRVSPDDGLTGFSATQAGILIIKDVSNEDELRSIYANLTWKKKIIEEGSPLSRTFFAMPLHGADGLIGVIRGHRLLIGGNFPFSPADENRLRLIQFLLESTAANKRS